MQRRIIQRHSSSRGVAFGEIIAILVVLAVLAAILFPLFAGGGGGRGVRTCMSNEKQIGLAVLQYTQDCDDLLPPPSRLRQPVAIANADHHPFPPDVYDSPVMMWYECLYLYLKSPSLLQCPQFRRPPDEKIVVSYRYSDLLYNVNLDTLTHPSNSVIAMDGEQDPFAVGHAYTHLPYREPAAFGPDGAVIPAMGAAVHDAARRHSGRASYLFADGHIKSLAQQVVFFPARANMSQSHLGPDRRPTGPDPNGDMKFGDRQYVATFHLN